MAVGDANHVDSQSAFLQQAFLLRCDLLQKASSYSAHATDEHVKVLVGREKKTVVYDVHRLFQLLARHDERYVQFESTAGRGTHIDTVAPERTEKFAHDTGHMAHVFAHHSHCGEVLLQCGAVHCAICYFAGKFGIESLTGAWAILRTDAEGDAGFGTRLSHHEHTDTGIGHRGEDALVHTHYTHHRHTRNGYHTRLVHTRHTSDGILRRCGVLTNDTAFPVGLEGVFNVNRDIFYTDGEDGWRVHHLCAEVAQFCRLLVTQFVYGVGRRYDMRVGCHETVHVCPYFQRLCIECCSKDGSGIVRPSASEVCRYSAADVAGYESTHDGYFRHLFESLANELVCRFEVDKVFVVSLCLDEFSGIIESGARNECLTNHR